MLDNIDLIVVGGGASGLMAGITAIERGKKVLIIEKKEKLARKVLITGKGRCNVTNCCDMQELLNNVRHNSKFLYSAFSKFGSYDTMEFFESRGVPLKVERGNRVFPCSDRAMDIVDCLAKYTQNQLCNVVNDTVTELIIKENKIVGVKTEKDEYSANCVIIATGGNSYPRTGSTGDGYGFARQAGHTVTKIRAGLIPIEINGKMCRDLMGLSLKNVSLKVVEKGNGNVIYSDMGEMLFTHFGISGPMVLSASMHIDVDKIDTYEIIIDLKPALSEKQLDNRLLRDFSENSNKDYVNILHGLLPNKMIGTFVKISGIDGHLKVNQISKEQRETIINTLKNIKLIPNGFRPIDEAIVTVGGVNTNEINPKTMESKLVEGLYFTGEVLDLDAYTGGFNLQIAFSTGYLAGLSIK